MTPNEDRPPLHPGQRCISQAEIQLGLGTVLKVEPRTVTVLFMATGDTRTYAIDNAPLSRIRFEPGDRITDCHGNRLTVTRVDEKDRRLIYTALDREERRHVVDESELDHFIQMNQPADRLFNGQIDTSKWFELRYRTLDQRNRLANDPLYGLTGVRTSLIPHQLYIAHEVANRYAPRVLLADEVGLGKTIEAGLILHHQLLTERARRVLIVVPETLLHQWLVEMLRRFNLAFSLFDEARWRDIEREGNVENPFFAEQRVLCSLDFLMGDETRFERCLAADWDLLVVDEAHHLQWSPQHSSEAYRLVERLSATTRGVLLLTATPEQLGKESHFARLRLLDPGRFPDYEKFLEEEAHYRPIANLIENLLDGKPVSDADWQRLNDRIGRDTESDTPPCLDDETQRTRLIENLLDRHGTGRVLFRNTRAAIRGFPERRLHACPLPPCERYENLPFTSLDERLHPEQACRNNPQAPDWRQFDPRVGWLVDTLNTLSPAKVLVITAAATTAIELSEHLKRHTGIHATAFHQGLSIIERDRAAAFFADHETGCQVLICSEIGSEGRNFQFSHHLVLFDLPLNPDLLEQRIGRLDRIGQTETIRIHVPYIENSATHRLFLWYQRGLSAFEKSCGAGHAVYTRVREQLHRQLTQPESGAFDTLLTSTRAHYERLTAELHQGRDRLLEYNACRPAQAEKLKRLAEQQDADNTIESYLEQAFDCFGIDMEPHSAGCHIIRPTEHMIRHFPGLPDEGMTITCCREIALRFEDAHYLTWEHPLCRTAMEQVLGDEIGNTALCAVDTTVTKAGTLLLECLFSVEVPPIDSLQTERYLPPTMIRTLCDEQGRSHHDRLTHAWVAENHKTVDPGIARKIVDAKNRTLRIMIRHAKQLAEQQASTILDRSHNKANQSISNEINRLKELSKVNSNIRPEEIHYFENQLASLDNVIDHARVRLDALRVIVVVNG